MRRSRPSKHPAVVQVLGIVAGAGAVGEIHGPQLERPLFGQGHRALGVGHARVHLEQPVDRAQRRPRGLEQVEQGREADYGVEQVGQVQHERSHHAHRREVVLDQEAPSDQDDGGRQHPGRFHLGEKPGREAHRLQLAVELGLVDLLEPLDGGALLPERLHHPDAGQALVERGEGVADEVAHPRIGASGGLAVMGGGDHHGDQRQHDHAAQDR